MKGSGRDVGSVTYVPFPHSTGLTFLTTSLPHPFHSFHLRSSSRRASSGGDVRRWKGLSDERDVEGSGGCDEVRKRTEEQTTRGLRDETSRSVPSLFARIGRSVLYVLLTPSPRFARNVSGGRRDR